MQCAVSLVGHTVTHLVVLFHHDSMLLYLQKEKIFTHAAFYDVLWTRLETWLVS